MGLCTIPGKADGLNAYVKSPSKLLETDRLYKTTDNKSYALHPDNLHIHGTVSSSEVEVPTASAYYTHESDPGNRVGRRVFTGKLHSLLRDLKSGSI